MKIFIVASGHPKWSEEKTGVFAWDQARALKFAGANISFLALDCRSLRNKRKLGFRYETIDDIPVLGLAVPIGIGGIFISLFYSIASLLFSILFKRALKLFGTPDCMHTHFFGMGVAAIGTSLRHSIPLIHTEHSSLIIQDHIDRNRLRIYGKVYKNATKVIAVSHALSKKIEQHFSVLPVVIPNIVELSLFSSNPSVHFESNKMFIVSAGNLVPSKQHNLTISVMPNLIREFPNLHLIIAGSGQEFDKLSDQIDRLGLRSHVTMTGHISREQLARIFQNSCFFVLPSRFETFGLVYAEAMAAGLPVIATKCGGPKDFVVDREDGLLIDFVDSASLEAAMRNMILNIDSFNREAISMKVVERFSPKRVAKQIIEIYENSVQTH